MNDDSAQPAPAKRQSAERGWRLLAFGVVVGGLALLAAFGGLGFGLTGLGNSAASFGRSLEAVMRSPDRGSPQLVGPGRLRTPAEAVLFSGGYFCAEGSDRLRVRLVLSLKELDTVTLGSTSVVGPFSSKAQVRDAC